MKMSRRLGQIAPTKSNPRWPMGAILALTLAGATSVAVALVRSPIFGSRRSRGSVTVQGDAVPSPSLEQTDGSTGR